MIGQARALLLDALGTLLTLEDPAPLLRSELARRFAVEVTEEEARRAIRAEIAYYRSHFDEGSDPAALAALRRRCAEALRSGLPADDRRITAIDTDSLTAALLASLKFSAFADARPALVKASGRRRLVVVSNWDVSLHEVFERLELAPLLDGIVTSAGVGARKPSTVIFDRALAVAGVQPHEAIHVGDSVDDDIAGARAAGIGAILVRRDGGAGPPGVRTIATLAAL